MKCSEAGRAPAPRGLANCTRTDCSGSHRSSAGRTQLSFNSRASSLSHDVFQLVWSQTFSCLLGRRRRTTLLPLPAAQETRPDTSEHRIQTLTTTPVLAFRVLGFRLIFSFDFSTVCKLKFNL